MVLYASGSIAVSNNASLLLSGAISYGSTGASRGAYVLSHVVLVVGSYARYACVFARTVARRFFRAIQVGSLYVVIGRGRVLALYGEYAVIVGNEVIGSSIPMCRTSLQVLYLRFFMVFGDDEVYAIVLCGGMLVVFMHEFLFGKFRASLRVVGVIFVQGGGEGR